MTKRKNPEEKQRPGRKPVSEQDRKKPRVFTLNDADYDRLVWLGRGNASQGLRTLLVDAQIEAPFQREHTTSPSPSP